MEARNFIAAREMLDNGKWLLPTMNGLPRLEKPPFPTWFSAYALSLFGESEFWLRLPAALMALILTFFTYRFSLLLFSNKNKAFASALIFISIPMVMIMGRTGSWDIFCISLTMVGLFYLFKLLKEPETRPWTNAVMAALFIGFSSMSKGPVGIYGMLIPFLFAYYMSYKPFENKPQKKYWLVFLALTIIIAAWWYVYARLEAPIASTEIAEKEVEAWANRHTQPFYFYFPLPFFTGVWASIVIYSFLFKRHKASGENNKQYVFLFLWIVSSVFMLSLVPEKKERYLLPVFPPLAILAGNALIQMIKKLKDEGGRENKLERVFWAIFNYLLLIGLFTAPIVMLIVFQKGGHMSYTGWVIFTAFSSILTFWALRNTRKKRYFQQLYVIGTVLALFSVSVLPSLPSFRYKNQDFKDIGEIREKDWYKETQLFSNIEINPKAIWRIGKPVKRIGGIENLTSKNFVLISYKKPSDAFSSEVLNSYEIMFLGEYDYYRSKSKYRLYVNRFNKKN